jgi:hypothetical protein
LSLLKAIVINRCEDRKNNTQYLLRVITAKTDTISNHEPYRKTPATGWEISFKNPKKLMDEATSVEPALFEDMVKVK